MTGREDKHSNDLFFLCSLIEYIGRKTNNHRNVVVNAIGKDALQHILDLADVYHSENIDKLTVELIEKHNIKNGNFDNISNAIYSIPTHWDIGKVYKRLIKQVALEKKIDVVDAIIEVAKARFVPSVGKKKLSDYSIDELERIIEAKRQENEKLTSNN